jgi:hypothetical protein
MSLTFENSCQAASDSMSVSEHSLTHTRDRDRDRDRDKDRDRASDSICMSEHSLVQSVAESEKESGRERESLLGAKRDNRGSRAEGGGGGGGGGGGEADRPLSVTTGSRSFKIQDIRATLKPQTLTLNPLSESPKDRHDRDEWDTAGEVYGSQRWTGGESKFLTGTVAEIVMGTVKGGEAFDRQRGTAGGQGNAEVADGGRSRLMLRSRQMTSQSARAMSSSGTAFRSQYTCTHTDRHKHTHAYPSARARTHTHTHTHTRAPNSGERVAEDSRGDKEVGGRARDRARDRVKDPKRPSSIETDSDSRQVFIWKDLLSNLSRIPKYSGSHKTKHKTKPYGCLHSQVLLLLPRSLYPPPPPIL